MGQFVFFLLHCIKKQFFFFQIDTGLSEIEDFTWGIL